MFFHQQKLLFGSFCSTFVGIALFLTSSLAPTTAAAADANATDKEVELVSRSRAGATLRVKTVVEVAGSLEVDATTTKDKDSKTRSLPMKVDAELFFDERGLAGEYSPSLRHYWDAKVDFDVNKATDHRELREDRRTILLSNGIVANDRFSSPLGPMTREELELVDVAASAFPPERLLPGKKVALDATWTHTNETIEELLRLERVNDGELVSEVTEINDEKVKVSIKGDITGKADGVDTKLEVVGNYHFDRKEKFVSWIALAIKEKREIGFSAPGFDVTSRIRTVRQTVPTSEALSDAIVKRLNTTAADSDRLLEFVSDDDFYRMALDRRWYQLAGRKSSATFRMVQDGNLTATCKIDQLARMVPGKQVTLDAFRDDVQSALGKSCKQIVSAGQTVNPQGVRVMRVVAAGEVGETPIRWIYYHLSDDNGQRLSYIFTHEASFEDRFAGIDEALTSSVEFLSKEERQARVETDEVK